MERWEDFIAGLLTGIVITMIFAASRIDEYFDKTFEVVEDNAVETIVSMKESDKTTLITINRYEDGLWITEYDGKSEPKTRRVE